MSASIDKIELQSASDQWFENLINSIRVDKMMYDTETVDPNKKKLYEDMMDGKYDQVFSEMYKTSSKYYIQEMVTQYLKILNEDHSLDHLSLSFDLSDSEVLVWAEINDDDEMTENKLILTEAKVNAKFSDLGFNLSSTIVEKGDNIKVPSHYYPLTKQD